jgi:Amt family ammonium transporter
MISRILNSLVPSRRAHTNKQAQSQLDALFAVMDEQIRTGDLRLRMPTDSSSEIGQIAERYNQVMNTLEGAMSRADAIVRSSMV